MKRIKAEIQAYVKLTGTDRPRMTKKLYAEYLQTEHWATMRRLALEHAGYACQFCNKGRCKLNVHHRTYERLCRERISDLTVLCEKCHGVAHKAGVLK